MNIVRCTQCGEISDLEKRPTCRGCGATLSAQPAGKRPAQISPVQREASADIDFSRNMLIAIVVTAGLGLSLIFIKEYGFMGAVLGIGLGFGVLFPIAMVIKKWRTATPELPAAPVPRVRSASLARPSGSADVGSAGSVGSSLEQGCGMVLKAIGIFIAVLLGLAVLGFLVLWVACLGSSGGLF